MDPAGVDQTTTSAAAGGGSDDNSGQKDHTHIVKRKRTKRQRQQPSFTFCDALYSSPATSDDFPADSTTTEDEDTAKCLILLSKGHSISPTKDNINDEYFSGYKFNSKRYIQTSSSAGDGLITGVYVYECKTCSRTFPSFQALGGHRASHKKPRVNEERRKPPAFMAFSDDDEPSLQFPSRKNNSSSSSSLSMQLNTRKSSSKLHECSICGTEFNSGQALGGHMRRHRVANAGAGAGTAINTNTTLSLIPYSPVTTMVAEDQDNQKSRNDGLCLDLDLNLPAPESSMAGEQRRDSSFKFTANQNKQQSAVHLSPGPTLVDCHY